MNKSLKFDLQLFAETTEVEPADNTEVVETEVKEDHAEKTFTRPVIAKMIAAEKSKWEQEFKEKVKEERDEAARLAKLSEEERQQAIIQKEKDDLEKEKAVFRQEQLLVEKGKQLQAIGIPSDLATRIQGNTAEEVMEDVKSFKTEWDKALKAAVDAALVSSVDNPLGSGTTNNTTNPFAKESFNLTEQGRLMREDPEKAKSLQALANQK